jgi:predicted ATP-grasp superfamily ATP-dependent carboligase
VGECREDCQHQGRPVIRHLRILLSEGSSTSAREAVTALGLRGHRIEVCDPNPNCLARFSRFVSKVHRCPGLGHDPAGFLAFVCDLLAREKFDVLLPIHEQGFLFARAPERLAPLVGVALPSFDSYRLVHGKAGFTRLLAELGLPHPPTVFVRSANELQAAVHFPCVIKTAIGTASRGIWILRTPGDLAQVLAQLADGAAYEGDVLVQDLVPGPVEHAQAVFCRGELIACHAYRQVSQGAGGGDAVKDSVDRPRVRTDLERMGARLAWHGALSVDYIARQGDDVPVYIDGNPRLVEPMSALIAGLDLAELLVQVSCGGRPDAAQAGRPGVRTHLAMQALLGCALRSGSRWELIHECRHLLAKRGLYQRSSEELTPVHLDWLGAVPLLATAILLLASPRLAQDLPRRGWGSHLLSTRSIRAIEQGFP